MLKLLKISGPSELLSRQSDIRHKSSAELEAMLDNRDSSSTYEYSKRQQRTSTQVEDGTEVDPLEPWTLTDGSQDDLQDTLPDQSAGEGANLEGLRSSPESTPDAEYAERKMKIVRFRKVFNPYTNAGFVLSRGSAQRNGKVLSWDETQVDPDNEGIHRSSHTEIDGDNADQCDDQVVSKLLVELPVSTETFASGEAHPVDQSTDRTLSASSTSASSTSIAGNQLAIYSTAVSLSDVGSRSSQEHLTHDNMEDLQRWLNSTCQSKMGNSQILAPTPIFSPKITEGFSTDRSAVHTIDYSHGSEPKVVLINNNVTGVSHIELVGGRQPGERNQLLKESLQSFEGTPKSSSSSSKIDSQLLTQTGNPRIQAKVLFVLVNSVRGLNLVLLA